MLERKAVQWFPMRVRHSSPMRLMKMKDLLDKEPSVAETYVAMKYTKVDDTTMTFTPAIDNLIFVRIAYDRLSGIKANKALFEPLRYIMRPVIEADGWEHREAVHVPEQQMRDFIRVTAEANDRVIYLDNLAFACKPGQKVQITEGQFAGVKGTIKRIKGNVCVVIPIKDTIAAAITGLHRRQLRYLTDEETQKD